MQKSPFYDNIRLSGKSRKGFLLFFLQKIVKKITIVKGKFNSEGDEKMAQKVVLAGACRTAIGKMGGALSNTPAADLGAIVIKEA